ncbi:MAG: class I SAM-dependent methyltransferase [Rubrivivax sp.]|nr:class I SAM-dependent methyltransferase [Rubrivivax sp.]
MADPERTEAERTEAERIVERYRQRDASAALSGFWSLTNPVALHLAQERERVVLALLAGQGVDLRAMQVLDVGCGAGGEFANYLRWGVPLDGLFGVDLVAPRVLAATRAFGPRVTQASGAALPFADGRFDLVVQNAVFSSIVDDAVRARVAAEMLRVLRPGGWLLWYDAERSRNRDPHFRDVPDTELRALFPGLPLQQRRLTTHLGLLRRVHALLGERGMAVLELTGLFKTHMLALGHKP